MTWNILDNDDLFSWRELFRPIKVSQSRNPSFTEVVHNNPYVLFPMKETMVAYGTDMNEPLTFGTRQRIVPTIGLENSAYVKKNSGKKRYNQNRKNAAEDFRRTLKVARIMFILAFWIIVIKWEGNTNETSTPPVSLSAETTSETSVTKEVNHQVVESQTKFDDRSRRRNTRSDTIIQSETIVRPQKKSKENSPPMIRGGDDSTLYIPRNARRPSRRYEYDQSIVIPSNIDSLLADIDEAISPSDVPFFWHILKSGGTTVKDAAGMCLGKVEASESGALDGHGSDQSLQKVKISHGRIEYANVDTTTRPGIERAISMDLVNSELTDVIFSPLLHDSSKLFNTNHKGRAFCLFRHPVERSVSLFYYLKHATWEPTFSKKLEKIETVEDYAVSEFAENNWMTRFLTNEMSGPLTKEHLKIAKEVVRRKIFVGLTLDLERSFGRFMQYLGWDNQNITSEQRDCLKKYLTSGSNRNKHNVEEGSRGWMALRSNNIFDLELYDYVLQLYEDQTSLLH